MCGTRGTCIRHRFGRTFRISRNFTSDSNKLLSVDAKIKKNAEHQIYAYSIQKYMSATKLKYKWKFHPKKLRKRFINYKILKTLKKGNLVHV